MREHWYPKPVSQDGRACPFRGSICVDTECEPVSVCFSVRVRVCVCVRARVCVRVFVYVCDLMWVRRNNLLQIPLFDHIKSAFCLTQHSIEL